MTCFPQHALNHKSNTNTEANIQCA